MELAYLLDVRKLLLGIDVPTLILHREGDKVSPIVHGRQLAAEIPNSRFKVLEGNVHLPWYGDSNELIEEIFHFLGRGARRDEAEVLVRESLAEDTGGFATEGAEVVEQATIVFSDIVSSTDLVTQLGDTAARDIFLHHDKIVRDQIKKHGGRELQNLGDGFMLSFESATAAIKCAGDIQKEGLLPIEWVKLVIE